MIKGAMKHLCGSKDKTPVPVPRWLMEFLRTDRVIRDCEIWRDEIAAGRKITCETCGEVYCYRMSELYQLDLALHGESKLALGTMDARAAASAKGTPDAS